MTIFALLLRRIRDGGTNSRVSSGCHSGYVPIAEYSSTIFLNPAAHQRLLIKWNKAYVASGLREGTLDDTNKGATLYHADGTLAGLSCKRELCDLSSPVTHDTLDTVDHFHGSMFDITVTLLAAKANAECPKVDKFAVGDEERLSSALKWVRRGDIKGISGDLVKAMSDDSVPSMAAFGGGVTYGPSRRALGGGPASAAGHGGDWWEYSMKGRTEQRVDKGVASVEAEAVDVLSAWPGRRVCRRQLGHSVYTTVPDYRCN
ncbi:hypothetical protein L210DRAFT_3711495 [Boletus edulis BED1]|uniref:Uncharacterized protein n=1 Tax=Boletus edulis BED1 TaxID=1328754 RepID=A0AAD4G942_BOLED|nr:hypothetical protein L210DRAFT_3507891 [Boletus edulis BED1]KAF8432791.1 hypothetical protein L210DRAFT_3711495 [Boletus edulis BED1]